MMLPFKRIMVALDLSDTDNLLIDYAFWFAQTMKTKKIYFANFVEELSGIDKGFLRKKNDTPPDEIIKGAVLNKINKIVPENQIEIEIIVDDKSPLAGLLRWQKIKNIDLLIAGKKNTSKGSGVLSRQFVRQAPCPVLFIPESAKNKIEKILVPVDFSENSRRGIEQAIQMYPYLQNPEITCQHVYFVDVYSLNKKLNADYSAFVYEKGVEEYEKFIKKYKQLNLPIKKELTPDREVNIVDKINDYAEQNNSDFMVIGAIGHSKLKLLSVGSTAEKMMLSGFNVPLLVVKA